MDRVEYEEEFVEIDLREYMQILWKRKWLIIGLVVIALAASYFLSSQMTRIYQTSVMVMVEEDTGAENFLSDKISLVGGQSNKIATYREMLKSRRTLNKVIEKLDLRSAESGEYIRAESLKNRISINVAGDTDLLNLTVTYPDPVMAAEIANTLISVFREDNLQLKKADLSGASDFINEQLLKVESDLEDLEESILKFKEENEVYFPEEQGTDMLERLSVLEKGKLEAELSLSQAQAGLTEYNKYLEREEERIITASTISKNPVVQNSKNRLAELELELSGLLEKYTEKHPQVAEIKAKIKNVEQRLRNTVEEIVNSRTESVNPLYQSLRERIVNLQTEIITSQVRSTTYQTQIDRIEKELEEIPNLELKITRLQREQKIAENIFLMLRQNREEIQIQQAMRSSDIIVIDPAIVREQPVKPNVKLNMAVAAVLALFIGIGLIFLVEFLDNTVRDEKELEKLTGLPVLGVIPRLDTIEHSPQKTRNKRRGKKK